MSDNKKGDGSKNKVADLSDEDAHFLMRGRNRRSFREEVDSLYPWEGRLDLECDCVSFGKSQCQPSYPGNEQKTATDLVERGLLRREDLGADPAGYGRNHLRKVRYSITRSGVEETLAWIDRHSCRVCGDDVFEGLEKTGLCSECIHERDRAVLAALPGLFANGHTIESGTNAAFDAADRFLRLRRTLSYRERGDE